MNGDFRSIGNLLKRLQLNGQENPQFMKFFTLRPILKPPVRQLRPQSQLILRRLRLTTVIIPEAPEVSRQSTCSSLSSSSWPQCSSLRSLNKQRRLTQLTELLRVLLLPGEGRVGAVQDLLSGPKRVCPLLRRGDYLLSTDFVL